MVPESGSNALNMRRAIVVLPEPDSPASTNVSAFLIENEISSATLVISLLAPVNPFFTKYFFKFLTERISCIVLLYVCKYIKRFTWPESVLENHILWNNDVGLEQD